MTSRNNKKRRVKRATKTQFCRTFFVAETSTNDLNKSSFFRCHLRAQFLRKNQLFSTYPKPSNHETTLFFATKTKHFHVLSKNRGPKNDQKNISKIVKKWVHKPQNGGSCRGKMVGCEK